MLEARGISKSFGGQNVLTNVNIEVRPGEVVGLVGMNGSGKTTLLDVLSGRVSPDCGEIWIDGQRRNCHRYEKHGRQLFRTYQIPRLFYGLTVADNLVLGRWNTGNRESLISGNLRQVRSENIASTLSIGQRRRVVLDWVRARVGGVRYFLLDEPAAGADEALISELLEMLKVLRSARCGVLMVEHRNGILKNSCDRLVHLGNGADAGEVKDSATVSQTKVPVPGAMAPAASRELSIEALEVTCGGAQVLKDVTVRAAAGSIVAVTGANGCGKSTLLRSIYGDPTYGVVKGRVIWDGYDITSQTLQRRLAMGIHLMPQEGTLFPSMTVEEALRTCVEAVRRDGWGCAPVSWLQTAFPLVERIWHRRCGLLSGGERRIVSLARVLLLQPKLALLDEPLAGVDGVGRELVVRALRTLAERGALVLVSEQESFVGVIGPEQVVTLSPVDTLGMHAS